MLGVEEEWGLSFLPQKVRYGGSRAIFGNGF